MVSVFLGLMRIVSLHALVIALRLTLIISHPRPFRQGCADGIRDRRVCWALSLSLD